MNIEIESQPASQYFCVDLSIFFHSLLLLPILLLADVREGCINTLDRWYCFVFRIFMLMSYWFCFHNANAKVPFDRFFAMTDYYFIPYFIFFIFFFSLYHSPSLSLSLPHTLLCRRRRKVNPSCTILVLHLTFCIMSEWSGGARRKVPIMSVHFIHYPNLRNFKYVLLL